MKQTEGAVMNAQETIAKAEWGEVRTEAELRGNLNTVTPAPQS